MENGAVYCKGWQSDIPGALGQPVQEKKKGIRIANQDFIILNQRGQQGGMNEKLLRSPSNRSHPKSISGFVPPTKKPPGISVFGKDDAAEKNRQGNARSSVEEAPFGAVFDDLLGWFCVILIIP